MSVLLAALRKSRRESARPARRTPAGGPPARPVEVPEDAEGDGPAIGPEPARAPPGPTRRQPGRRAAMTGRPPPRKAVRPAALFGQAVVGTLAGGSIALGLSDAGLPPLEEAPAWMQPALAMLEPPSPPARALALDPRETPPDAAVAEPVPEPPAIDFAALAPAEPLDAGQAMRPVQRARTPDRAAAPDATVSRERSYPTSGPPATMPPPGADRPTPADAGPAESPGDARIVANARALADWIEDMRADVPEAAPSPRPDVTERDATESDPAAERPEAPAAPAVPAAPDAENASPPGIVVGGNSLDPAVGDRIRKAAQALQGGAPAAAAAQFRQALDDAPERTDALMGLARAQERLGDAALAMETYHRLLDIDPGDRRALRRLLRLAAEAPPEEALRQLEALRFTHAGMPLLHARIAQLQAEAGETEQAVEAMRRAVDLDSRNLRYRYNLAVLYDRAGKDARAAQAYRQLLRQDRGDLEAAGLAPDTIRRRLDVLGG